MEVLVRNFRFYLANYVAEWVHGRIRRGDDTVLGVKGLIWTAADNANLCLARDSSATLRRKERVAAAATDDDDDVDLDFVILL
jgi:hypothetical protein